MPKTKRRQAVDNNFEQIMAEIAERQRTRLETAKNTLKTNIIPRLKKLGIVTVQAHYSGYGDEGCIDTVEYLDANNKPIATLKGRTSIDASLQDVLDGFLPSGFEIEDGSQGDITIDVQSGMVTLEHQENYVQHNDTTLEYTL